MDVRLFDLEHKQAMTVREDGTGKWILRTDEFQDWISDNRISVLWCHGPRM